MHANNIWMAESVNFIGFFQSKILSILNDFSFVHVVSKLKIYGLCGVGSDLDLLDIEGV